MELKMFYIATLEMYVVKKKTVKSILYGHQKVKIKLKSQVMEINKQYCISHADIISIHHVNIRT